MSLTDYTAASEWPWKLIRQAGRIRGGRVPPLHLQLYPTNRCNAACPWCSCAKVDRAAEMPTTEALAVLSAFRNWGAQAVTISGGGEPTLHAGLRAMLLRAQSVGMRAALVTNGILWGAEDADLSVENETLSWVRVSVPNVPSLAAVERFERICDRLPDVDVGLSYTVAGDVDMGIVRAFCEAAERHANCTHLRFVQELLDLPEAGIAQVERRVGEWTDKAIVQRRGLGTLGCTPCLVSLLRPVVDPAGMVYPCCGVQYAGDPDTRTSLPREFAMGHWREFNKFDPFDGSRCRRCYYGEYNAALAKLLYPAPAEHEAFV